MQIVAVVSACGGVGRSTLVATLADLLHRRGRPVLAIEFDVANALALHLGASIAPQRGLVQALDAQASPWFDAVLANSDGVQFLPYGQGTLAQQVALEARLHAAPRWLREQLEAVQLPESTVVLLDTPRLPALAAQHAVHCADHVLAVLAPDANSYATLGALAALKPGGINYVINGLEPNRPLQNDLRLLLRDELGAALATVAIHREGSLADAQARNRALVDEAPHSQASQDFQLLAAWLLSELERAQR